MRIPVRPPTRGAARRRDTAGRDRRDTGFILLESLLSIAMITVVMAGLATFFTTSLRVTNHLRYRQVASQLADSAVENVRAYSPGVLQNGRNVLNAAAQYTAGVATGGRLATLLGAMTAPGVTGVPAVVDPAATVTSGLAQCGAAVTGSCAYLPTSPVQQVLGGKSFGVSYYLGTCVVQVSGSSACTAPAVAVGAGGIQSVVAGATTGTLTYLRIVVAVTWTDATCTTGCTYPTTTLVSADPDPRFNLNEATTTAPRLDPLPPRSSLVGDAVSFGPPSITTGTGLDPFTFTDRDPTINGSTGTLPPGVTITPTGTVSGAPTTAGTFQVTLGVTDAVTRTDTATFAWTVRPLTPTAVGTQTSTAGSPAAALTFTVPGGPGSGALTWSASNLPAGLIVDANSGQVSGTPTTSGSRTVTVTAHNGAAAASTSFTWTVQPALVVAPVAAQTSVASNAVVPVTPSTSGGPGTGTPSWSATGLPAGLTVNPATGVVSGTLTAATGTSTVTLTVRAGLAVASTTFPWTVTTTPTLVSAYNTSLCATASGTSVVAATCPAPGGTTAAFTYGDTSTLASGSSCLVDGATFTSVTLGSCTVVTSTGATGTPAGAVWTFRADGTVRNGATTECLAVPTTGTALVTTTCPASGNTPAKTQIWSIR